MYEVSSQHPVSNLRLIRRTPPTNESEFSRELRKEQDHLQEWNHDYWKEHNTKFFTGKDQVIKQSHDKANADLTSFYTHFLEENYEKHAHYSL